MQATTQTNSEEYSLNDLRTIDQMVAEHPILTKQMIRWHLRHRRTNGLASACVPLGRSIGLIKPKYEAWLLGGHGAKVSA